MMDEKNEPETESGNASGVSSTIAELPAATDAIRGDVPRRADGKFAPGAVGNPTGYNGERRKGFTPWSIRVEQLEEKYPTVRALLQMFVIDEKNGTVKASDEMLELNPFDAGILWGMFSQIYGSDRRGEREAFWDRKEGRPKETVKHEGGVAHGLDPTILSVLQNVRRSHAVGSDKATPMVEHSPTEPDRT